LVRRPATTPDRRIAWLRKQYDAYQTVLYELIRFDPPADLESQL
jgi:hypothetical protein